MADLLYTLQTLSLSDLSTTLQVELPVPKVELGKARVPEIQRLPESYGSEGAETRVRFSGLGPRSKPLPCIKSPLASGFRV